MLYVVIPSHSVTIKYLPSKYTINLGKENQNTRGKNTSLFSFCAFQKHIFLGEALVALYFFLISLQKSDKLKCIKQTDCYFHYLFFLVVIIIVLH